MLYLYNMDITQARFNNNDMFLTRFLPNSKKIIIENQYYDIDKLLTLYSGLLLRLKISTISGISIESLEFINGCFGKPEFKHDKKIYFNISHTRSHILCSISLTSELGADVEKVANPPYEVMEIAFHQSERDYINSIDAYAKEERFYEVWTKKESYLKKIGTGLIDSMAEINTLELENNFYSYKYSDYMCSVCYDHKPNKIIRENVSLGSLRQYFLNL